MQSMALYGGKGGVKLLKLAQGGLVLLVLFSTFSVGKGEGHTKR